MSLDRADLPYASKEISRGMSSPKVGDIVRLKRILRYLKGTPRAYYLFAWQHPPGEIVGFCDSDWAGCARTRKSTSGGFIMHGSHTLSQWSSTQAVVALSSAEAELNASVKIISEALGVKQLYEEMHHVKKVVVHTDSSACLGILHREGCGKVKHLETRQLWTQSHVSNRSAEVLKVPREFNPSDCLTHYWSAVDGPKHFKHVGLMFPPSRAIM